MIAMLNALLVVIFLLNLFVLGTSRIRALIQAAALQGVVLGAMPILVHGHLSLLTGLVAIATILVKGSLIPAILFKALRDAQIKREVEPIIGFLPSTLLGALGTAAAIAAGRQTPPGGRPRANAPGSCRPFNHIHRIPASHFAHQGDHTNHRISNSRKRNLHFRLIAARSGAVPCGNWCAA